jgi:uncharacterized protein (TIGR03067 family)
VVLATAAASLGFAPAPFLEAKELRQLQGEWVLVDWAEVGRTDDGKTTEAIRIVGKRIQGLRNGKLTGEEWALAVRTRRPPFALDLTGVAGSGKGQVDRCLFRFQGDTLVLYRGKARFRVRDTERPKSFGSAVRVETYRRKQ